MSANRTVLIIYPHWPPSNLVGVHRVRLIANHLHTQGWHPIVLTIDESGYEEPPVPELNQLVHDSVEVIKVEARPVLKVLGKRTIGDIGLRGFKALKKGAMDILKARRVDFIWFSMPSWYPSLMGPSLRKKYGTPYGIDYQDPWVYDLPDDTPRLSRARLTRFLAILLEPHVLRRTSLITAINGPYVSGITERHPELDFIPRSFFQLGFDEQDHQLEVEPPLLWKANDLAFLYAGAFLPLSAPFHQSVLRAAKKLLDKGAIPNNIRFVYVGTGRPDLPLLALAKQEGMEDHVTERPDRISFLEVQQLLRSSQANMVIGSPEPHYSASKVFQCILSGRPTLAVLHGESEAADILARCGGGSTIASFSKDLNQLEQQVYAAIQACLSETIQHLDHAPLAPYHAREAARELAAAMDAIVKS